MSRILHVGKRAHACGFILSTPTSPVLLSQTITCRVGVISSQYKTSFFDFHTFSSLVILHSTYLFSLHNQHGGFTTTDLCNHAAARNGQHGQSTSSFGSVQWTLRFLATRLYPIEHLRNDRHMAVDSITIHHHDSPRFRRPTNCAA